MRVNLIRAHYSEDYVVDMFPRGSIGNGRAMADSILDQYAPAAGWRRTVYCRNWSLFFVDERPPSQPNNWHLTVKYDQFIYGVAVEYHVWYLDLL